MHTIENPAAECAWLDERLAPGNSGLTGYDVPGWEANVWVLHSIYENLSLPGSMTHDDVNKAGIHAGEVEPLIIGSVNLDERSWLTGGGLGRSRWPGPGWSRLHWQDLAARLGIHLDESRYPTTLQFPYRSWPINIQPPTEGSLDREQFLRLVGHLVIQSADEETPCHCYYSPLTHGEIETKVVYRATLKELPDLYDLDDVSGSPTNLWPIDRTWLMYTDWDLCGTRVSGPAALIDAIRQDPGLETRSP